MLKFVLHPAAVLESPSHDGREEDILALMQHRGLFLRGELTVVQNSQSPLL